MEHKATAVVFGCGKGGVGKTTSCVCMAHLLGKRGKNVLLIDTDHQGNASKEFGFFEDSQSKRGFYDYLYLLCKNPRRDSRPDIADYIRESNQKNVYIVTGDPRLQDDELNSAITSLEIKLKLNPMNILVQRIKELNFYDYIFIDTHPDMGIMVTSSFQAADWVLVPTTVSDNALDGATNTVYFVEDLQDAGFPVKLAGVFFSMVNTRGELAKVNIPAARENRFKPNDVLDTVIRQSEDIKKAENRMLPASAAYPSCNAVIDYKQLVREVVNKIG